MGRVLDPHDCAVEDLENWVLQVTAAEFVEMGDCDTSGIKQFQGNPKLNVGENVKI
jgi:hypothetical protein